MAAGFTGIQGSFAKVGSLRIIVACIMVVVDFRIIIVRISYTTFIIAIATDSDHLIAL